MGNLNFLQHRASIGRFYYKACRLPGRKYMITDKNLALPYALIYTYGLKAIHLALFLYISTDIRLDNPDNTAKSSKNKLKY